MKTNFSEAITPKTSTEWLKQSESSRIEKINMELKKSINCESFEAVDAPDNGQIVLKIEKIIPANERGLLLLDLENKLKLKIDAGITVWCEPVGDKSKLRKLRGIKITT
jgi:hypothetical protein